MGEKLDASFDKAKGTLKKGFEAQRGGTCGLYCLWYASLLLSTFSNGKPIVWPRRSEIPQDQRSSNESMRHFAKTVGSGQGEIVNLQEMSDIILRFGFRYNFVANTDDAERTRFIKTSLAAEQPILFPYLEGGDPAKDCRPIRQKDNNCGAHWSLLFRQTDAEYGILDPHWPDTPRNYAQSDMLAANAAADSVQEPQIYKKSAVQGLRPGQTERTYQVMSKPGVPRRSAGC